MLHTFVTVVPSSSGGALAVIAVVVVREAGAESLTGGAATGSTGNTLHQQTVIIDVRSSLI